MLTLLLEVYLYLRVVRWGLTFIINQITYLDVNGARLYYNAINNDKIRKYEETLLNLGINAGIAYLTSLFPYLNNHQALSFVTSWSLSTGAGHGIDFISMDKDAIMEKSNQFQNGIVVYSVTSYTSVGFPVQ